MKGEEGWERDKLQAGREADEGEGKEDGGGNQEGE